MKWSNILQCAIKMRLIDSFLDSYISNSTHIRYVYIYFNVFVFVCVCLSNVEQR